MQSDSPSSNYDRARDDSISEMGVSRRALDPHPLDDGRCPERDSWSCLSPRERLENLGATTLSDIELVALLLGTGGRREPVGELAHRLLRVQGGLRGLGRLAPRELRELSGVGVAKSARLCAAVELGRRVSGRPWQPGQPFLCSQQVFEHYRYRLRDERCELFWVALLDARNRLMGEHEVSRGSLVASIVHPREVFRPAVRAAAASLICVHNHPSGDPGYSAADVAVTERLVRAGRMLGIPILDHIVIGAGGYTSLADSGVPPFASG